MEKLSASIPVGERQTISPPPDLPHIRQLIRELAKTAETGGHWRKLDPGQEGHGQGGSQEVGRTWVHRDNTLPTAELKPHQMDFQKAVTDMEDTGGIIAAHGTGTGKTFSAINAFEKLKGLGRAERALVITPSGLRNNFLTKGIQRFTTSKGQIISRPTELSPDTEYAIVSYDAYRRRPQEFIKAFKPDTIIADEVHRASNPDSKTFQAMQEGRREVDRFMGLTASITQNKPDEIVPLLELTTGGKSDIPSKKSFRKHHISTTQKPGKGIFGGKTYEENLIQRVLLKSTVGANIHYVEDLDASEKPQKIVESIQVPMSGEQIDLYRMSMKGVDPVIVKKIKAGEPVSQKQAMELFTRLLRARQVSNSLNSIDPSMAPEEAARRTPKIKRILDDAVDHIGNTSDGQVILYTNLVHGGVDVLAAGLKDRGIPFGVFAGKGVKGMTEEVRQAAVEDYLAGRNRAIIITGAGAEGLSLGNTTMVQLVDGHYNPERIAQAEARGIRAGGLSQRPIEERKVQVKRYVSSLPKSFWQTITFQPPEKGVEEWVYLTAERKNRLNRQLRDVLAERTAHEKKQRDSVLYRTFGGGP